MPPNKSPTPDAPEVDNTTPPRHDTQEILAIIQQKGFFSRIKWVVGAVMTFIGAVTGVFSKLDAYAEGKIDAGVETLRIETNRELAVVKTDIAVIKTVQANQASQLDRIETSQSEIMGVLLDIKREKKDGGH